MELSLELIFFWTLCNFVFCLMLGLTMKKIKFDYKKLRDILVDQKLVEAVEDLLLRVEKIEEKLGLEDKEPEAVSVIFYTTKKGKQIKLGGSMFLKINEKLPLSVSFADAQGNAAKVDGAPAWALSDASIGDLIVAADGMSAEFAPKAVGACKVQVNADADMGSGIKSILGELDVEVLALEAVSVVISAGAAYVPAPVVVDPAPVEPTPENPLDLNTGN